MYIQVWIRRTKALVPPKFFRMSGLTSVARQADGTASREEPQSSQLSGDEELLLMFIGTEAGISFVFFLKQEENHMLPYMQGQGHC